MSMHNLSNRGTNKVIRAGNAALHAGLQPHRRLYRVTSGRYTAEFPQAPALHSDGQYRWCVQGEALWTSKKLAQLAADAYGGTVEDATAKYTVTLYR